MPSICKPTKLTPRMGALAYDHFGVLGVITSDRPVDVEYSDGSTGRAWKGVVVRFTDYYKPFGYDKGDKTAVPGEEWSSKCPTVVGYTDDFHNLYPASSGHKTTVKDWDYENGEVARNRKLVTLFNEALDRHKRGNATSYDYECIVEFVHDGEFSYDYKSRKPYKDPVSEVAHFLGYPLPVAKALYDTICANLGL